MSEVDAVAIWKKLIATHRRATLEIERRVLREEVLVDLAISSTHDDKGFLPRAAGNCPPFISINPTVVNVDKQIPSADSREVLRRNPGAFGQPAMPE